MFINIQNIEKTTHKAALIKMPNDSLFKGLTFWHPLSLIREEGGNSYFLSISFTEDFEFELFKTNKHYKKTRIEHISADEMIQAFEKASKSIKESIQQSRKDS
ncbi:hypothetical protein [Enterococcus sp. BWB1-3]|uniref:hypothetical protein n=1 Tax=Enterococcus sp. BWB1-3 TaxID=2787713 RepID=UPI001923392C|nr:hypothetical protein [Enterococcus sp. BWB1-3]